MVSASCVARVAEVLVKAVNWDDRPTAARRNTRGGTQLPGE